MWENNRFLVPEILYLVKGINYSIKSNNFNYSIPDENVLFEINSPTFSYSFKETGLICSNLSGNWNTELVGVYNNDFMNALSKSITLQVSDTNKTQREPKILIVGDSITNRDIPYLVKMWLQQFGIKPTMLGTMKNSAMNKQIGDGFSDLFPYENGEGREGWRWTDFAFITEPGSAEGRPKISSELNNVNTNPFVNPNTKSFDFSYYMNTQDYEGVDFITIMLGTNDICNWNPFGGKNDYTLEEIITNMKDSYDIIEESIHKYDPNIKIGVIPPIPAGVVNISFRDMQVRFIEEELSYLKTKNNTYILGNYLATSIYSGKKNNDFGSEYSSKNNTKKLNLSGDVHDIWNNETINALWSASWIMNMLN